MKKKLQAQFYRNIGLRLICFGLLLSGFIPGVSYASSPAGLSAKAESNARVNVTGTVKDSKGEPLIGVSVKIKGTNTGTSTDVNGVFRLNLPTGNEALVFSYIGFESYEVAVNGRTMINVVLRENTSNLEEVVVVGYAEQKKATVAGSIAVLQTKEIEDIPASNLSTLLQNRLPGVGVGGVQSGRPGVNTALNIRTNTSFNAAPALFVIDGFVRDASEGQAAFDRLDPSEIESISILKDASAAVYGARGAGGVVLVKTKRGTSDSKARISYSGSFGSSTPVKIPDMLTSYEHAKLLNENYRLTTTNPTDLANKIFTDDELEAFKSLNYNRIDDFLENSDTYRNTVNVRGGTDKMGYFGSGTFYDESGNLPGTKYDKFTLRAGIDAKITDNLSASLTLSTDNSNAAQPYVNGDQTEPMTTTFGALLRAPRWVPVYINGLPVGQSGLVTNHIEEVVARNNYSRNKGSNSTYNASLEYKIPGIEGFRAKVSYNRNESNSYSKSHRIGYTLYNFSTSGGNKHIIGDQVTGTSKVTNSERLLEDYAKATSYQFNGSLMYDNKFGKHTIGALLVYEQAESEGNNFRAQREGNLVPTDERQGAFNPANASTDGGATNFARLSYIGRLNYNYAEKYILEAAFRYEGSLRFDPSNRWGFFPSVLGAWRISEEPFFKDHVSFINNLKLRASYGLVGNDDVVPRQYELSYGITTSAYLGGSSLTTGLNPRNSGLILDGQTWEKTRTFNAGLDVGFKNNITLTFDTWYKYNFDILVQKASSLPTSTGINSPPKENYGRAEGWGFDGGVGYNGKVGKDLGYNLGVNFSYGRSKVLTKPQSAGVIGTWQDEIGKIPGGQAGYIALGIMRTQEEVDAWMAQYPNYKINGEALKVGMLYFKDIGGPNYSDEPDGIISNDDRRMIAPAKPDVSFGFNIGVSWKGIRVNTNLGLSGIGQKAFYDTEALTVPTGTLNSVSIWRDYYSAENINASMPRPVDNAYVKERSTFWMRDGLMLVLNNADVSYSFPQSLLQKLRVPSVRIFFSGRNLWNIISPIDYRDPAISSYARYPTVKTYNFGLNIGI